MKELVDKGFDEVPLGKEGGRLNDVATEWGGNWGSAWESESGHVGIWDLTNPVSPQWIGLPC